MKKRIQPGGFTLVETVLALAVVSLGLIAVLLVIPMALQASHTAATQTVTATILEDIHDRIKGQPLVEGAVLSGPFYFDEQGLYIPSKEGEEAGAEEPTVSLERAVYRVDVELSEIHPDAIPEGVDSLMSVTVEIGWPVLATGNVNPDSRSHRASVSYFVTALSGVGWEWVDPKYQRRIDF